MAVSPAATAWSPGWRLRHRVAAVATLAWASAVAVAAPPAAAPPHALEQRPGEARSVETFDPEHTRFSFELRTRWGQKVAGQFPRYDGELTVLADGRHQVRIRLAAGAVVVGDSERYTRLARGERFFNAPRYPYIEFLSEPHSPDLARTGGPLRGRLTLHGVSRMETFILAPATCAKPGEDCDGIAHGSVSRDDYGLDGWQLALGDRVRFTMQVRLQSTQSKLAPPKSAVPKPAPSRNPDPVPAKPAER
ncbi:YceI family protein [Lysobacter capsici]|uniref:YceI family protein n=1 Tax=Lysobacter capsici TaxID=435897 RepID=UPI00165173E8|nr:YceI family protein [Lysobacter capsici]